MSVGAAVKATYAICPDGTPVSLLDVRDMQERVRRREMQAARDVKRGYAGQEVKLMQYLASRPGGEAWRSSDPLRAHLQREERVEEAAYQQAMSEWREHQPQADRSEHHSAPSVEIELRRSAGQIGLANPRWVPPRTLAPRFGKTLVEPRHSAFGSPPRSPSPSHPPSPPVSSQGARLGGTRVAGWRSRHQAGGQADRVRHPQHESAQMTNSRSVERVGVGRAGADKLPRLPHGSLAASFSAPSLSRGQPGAGGLAGPRDRSRGDGFAGQPKAK